MRALILTTVFSVACSAAAVSPSVRVSDFGYDEADSTRFLQAAIDSGAKRVVIDARRWVSLPLKCRGEQELFFEDGAVVEAKKGAFLGKHDMLFAVRGCTNLTIGGKGEIRMHHGDYLKPPYAKSEHRHAICVRDSANVRIWGLKILNGGGDGVYLGGGRSKEPNPAIGCRDIRLEDLHIDTNVRQGLSVTFCDGLTVERCSFLNTRGLPPMAGIDFEPNSGYNRIRRIVVRDCAFSGNHGQGVTLALGRLWRETDPTCDITFERCRFIHDNVGGGMNGGRIVFRDCVFEDPKVMPIGISGGLSSPVGCTIDGCVVRENGKDFPIDEKWLRENAVFLSSSPEALSKQVRPDFTRAKVFDSKPGKMRRLLGKYGVVCRRRANFVVYADSARCLVVKTSPVKRRGKMSAVSFSVTDAVTGKPIEKRGYPSDGTIAFDAPAKGFYSVKVELVKDATLPVLSANCPLAFDMSEGALSLMCASGTFLFHVPHGAQRFEVLVSGSGQEVCRAAVYRPDGSVAWSNECIAAWCGHLQRGAAPEGMWRLSIGKSKRGRFEDMGVSLTGVPGLLFADQERYWK